MNDFEDRLRRHVDALTPEGAAPYREVLSRRDGRRRRRRALATGGTALVAIAVVVLGTRSPGQDDHRPDSTEPATSSPAPTERPEPTYVWSNRPAPVVLRLADRDLELDPTSYCWSGPPDRKNRSRGRCSDGWPQMEDLVRVGSPGSVDFWFGVEGWDFDATFTELGGGCRRQHTVPVERTGDQTFRIDPVGAAGRYRVNLVGRGHEGDVIADFLWTTPADGPTDEPSAHVALIGGNREELTSYGLEIGVEDLAFQPREAEAEVTVTAANGRSMSLDAELVEHDGCYAEGSLSFRGVEDQAGQAARLGPSPFTYRVDLTLDGERHVGTAVWPRDELPDLAPNTALSFDPPLPAYAIP